MKRNRIPDLWLEKLALNEMPSGDRAQWPAETREAMQALQDSNATILAEYPPDMVAGKLRKLLLGRSRPRVFRRTSLVFASLVSVLLGVSLLTWQRPYEATKGGEPHLNIYRKSAGAVDRLGDNDLAKPGELLQVSYVAYDAAFGAIFSIDGRGKVTLHFPSNGTEAVRLSSTGETLLPNAFELDDSPYFERFFLVTSDRSPAWHPRPSLPL